MQKFVDLLDTNAGVNTQITEALEIVTYIVTPVALYSALALIVGGVSIVIAWFIQFLTIIFCHFNYSSPIHIYLFIYRLFIIIRIF